MEIESEQLGVKLTVKEDEWGELVSELTTTRPRFESILSNDKIMAWAADEYDKYKRSMLPNEKS
jgi:hypothetical protein